MNAIFSHPPLLDDEVESDKDLDSRDVASTRESSATSSRSGTQETILRSINSPSTPSIVVTRDDRFICQQLYNAVPAFSAELEKELINVYFTTAHIICPVIKKDQFLSRHTPCAEKRTLEESLVVFSIFFVAFGYVTETQLRQTPFSTVHEARRNMFELVNRFYHIIRDDESRESTFLTQIALLLSDWSPYDKSKTVDTYWVCQAFKHATAGRLFEGNQIYDRVIWWSCITKNRILALGLRKPNSLQISDPGAMVCVNDFDPNLMGDLYSSRCVEMFVSLCELSDIMSWVTILRHLVNNPGTALQGTWTTGPGIHHLERVMAADRALLHWLRDYDSFVSQCTSENLGSHGSAVLHSIRVLSLSTIAWLHEPYICSSSTQSSTSWMMSDFALNKLQDVSTRIGTEVLYLETLPAECIPSVLAPWILLPATFNFIDLNVRPAAIEDKRRDRCACLLRLLHTMALRYEGAKYVARVMKSISSMIRTDRERQASARSREFLRFHPELNMVDLLLFATNIINFGLEAQ